MIACKELKRMFDIEDEEDDAGEHDGHGACRKFHKSVDLGRASLESA